MARRAPAPCARIVLAYLAPRRAAENNATLLRNFIFWLAGKKRVTDAIARRGMKYGFARRFIPGETMDEAVAAAAELARAGRRVLLNELGENVATPDEARIARDHYIHVVQALDAAKLEGHASIKLTHLGLDFDPQLCASLVQDIAAAAKSLGSVIEIDMEGSAYTSRTLDIFEAAQRLHGNIGLAIQSYLRRSENDIERLAPLAPTIRLVKGAYREPPEIAFQRKEDVDSAYRRLLDRLLRPAPSGRFFAAIATHDPALICYAEEKIREFGVAGDAYEFQMIYGVRRDLQEQVRAAGHPLRIYLPFGPAWVPYFMRRLAERPANAWFVLRSVVAERKASR